jgi:hypothetical protein
MGNKGSKKYIVYVDDNYHFMDEDERYVSGEFDDCESAKKHCMGIVNTSLMKGYRRGMDWNELLKSYKAFGEDPWVSSLDADCQFSAWDYAEQRCQEICKTQNG